MSYGCDGGGRRGGRRAATAAACSMAMATAMRFSGAPSDRISARTVSNHQHHENAVPRLPRTVVQCAAPRGVPERPAARPLDVDPSMKFYVAIALVMR